MLFHINNYCYILTQTNSEFINLITPSKKGKNNRTKDYLDLSKIPDSPVVNSSSRSSSSDTKTPQSMEDLERILENVFVTSDKKPSASETIISKFNIDMTTSDLARLRPDIFLNDFIIEFYGEMLMEYDTKMCNAVPGRISWFLWSSHMMDKLLKAVDDSDYADVVKWTYKHYSIFKIGNLMLPINISNHHWTLAIVYVEDKKIIYYDSYIPKRSTSSNVKSNKYLDAILKWLEYESHKPDVDIGSAFGCCDDWTLSISDRTVTPQQRNGYDCGCFVIKMMDCFVRGDELNFTYNDIVGGFRKKVGTDIIRGHLDYSLPEYSIPFLCDHYRERYNNTKMYDPEMSIEKYVIKFHNLSLDYFKNLTKIWKAKRETKTLLQLDLFQYKQRQPIKKFQDETKRLCINVYGDGHCWWRCLSYFLFGKEASYEMVRSILVWFVIMPNDHFAKVFGEEKLLKRTELLTFLQITNSLERHLAILEEKGEYGEMVWVDLLILSIIYPEKKFCVLTFEKDEENVMKVCIGEKSEAYHHCMDVDIPDIVHDLFQNIYKGTELVQYLNNSSGSSSSSSSTFEYNIDNICFILFVTDYGEEENKVPHYFVMD